MKFRTRNFQSFILDCVENDFPHFKACKRFWNVRNICQFDFGELCSHLRCFIFVLETEARQNDLFVQWSNFIYDFAFAEFGNTIFKISSSVSGFVSLLSFLYFLDFLSNIWIWNLKFCCGLPMALQKWKIVFAMWCGKTYHVVFIDTNSKDDSELTKSRIGLEFLRWSCFDEVCSNFSWCVRYNWFIDFFLKIIF